MTIYELQMFNATSDGVALAYRWRVSSDRDEWRTENRVREILRNWPEQEAVRARLVAQDGTVIWRWNMRTLSGRPIDIQEVA